MADSCYPGPSPEKPSQASFEPLMEAHKSKSVSPCTSDTGGRGRGLRSRPASVPAHLDIVGGREDPATPPRVRRLLAISEICKDRSCFAFLTAPNDTAGVDRTRFLCALLIALCTISFAVTLILGRDALCEALPGTLFCRTALGFTPLPRDDSDAIFGPGSLFGHLYINMECPSVRTEEYPPEPHDDFDIPYTPSTVFPVGNVVPDGRSAVPSDVSVDGAEQLTLLVGVLSSCSATAERQVARDTWMRLAVPQGTTWRSVFLLSYKCAEELREEQEVYGDLLFFHTQESYYALTPKVLEFFEYAHNVGARYTMKTDDDTFVFVNRILSELRLMPDSCLYWGSKSQLPWLDKYKGSGLDVPLNKWYIQKEDYRVLAGTRYMAGGGYVLSKDLVAKVVENKVPLADRLPEDASLGRALGDIAFDQCACHDTRFVHSATAFQHVQFFHPAVEDCERADIARRVFAVHGIKNASHMVDMLRYGTTDYDLECMVSQRNYNTPDWIKKYWGRDVSSQAYQIDPIGFTGNVHNQLVRDEVDPWWLRKNFVPFRELWNTSAASTDSAPVAVKPGSYFQFTQLAPLRRVLEYGLSDGNTSDSEDDGIPWCLRLKWSSDIIGMVAELADRKTLLCDIQPSFFFIEKDTLEMQLHRGALPVTYDSQRYHSRSVCFSDLQCHACFRQAAETWLPNGKCDAKRGQCVGFDAISQAKVVIRNIISLLLPSGWSSSLSESSNAVQRDLEDRVAWIMEEVFEFADYIGGNTTSEKLHESAKAVQMLLHQSECQECLDGIRWDYHPESLLVGGSQKPVVGPTSRKMLGKQ